MGNGLLQLLLVHVGDLLGQDLVDAGQLHGCRRAGGRSAAPLSACGLQLQPGELGLQSIALGSPIAVPALRRTLLIHKGNAALELVHLSLQRHLAGIRIHAGGHLWCGLLLLSYWRDLGLQHWGSARIHGHGSSLGQRACAWVQTHGLRGRQLWRSRRGRLLASSTQLRTPLRGRKVAREVDFIALSLGRRARQGFIIQIWSIGRECRGPAWLHLGCRARTGCPGLRGWIHRCASSISSSALRSRCCIPSPDPLSLCNDALDRIWRRSGRSVSKCSCAGARAFRHRWLGTMRRGKQTHAATSRSAEDSAHRGSTSNALCRVNAWVVGHGRALPFILGDALFNALLQSLRCTSLDGASSRAAAKPFGAGQQLFRSECTRDSPHDCRDSTRLAPGCNRLLFSRAGLCCEIVGRSRSIAASHSPACNNTACASCIRNSLSSSASNLRNRSKSFYGRARAGNGACHLACSQQRIPGGIAQSRACLIANAVSASHLVGIALLLGLDSI